MRKPLFYLFLLAALPGQVATAQSYTVPFKLTEQNNLSIQAILNKKDTVQLMFHTAANSVMLTEEATKRLQTIQFNGVDSVSSWGGGGNAARFSKSNELQIGGMEWTGLPIWEDKNSGQHTDGKFGAHLFEGKVIEIDFDKKVMTISPELPSKAKRYDKLKLAFKNDNMFVEAVCTVGDSSFTNRFLVHSGYYGGLLLDDQFVNAHQLGEKLKITGTKELKDSYGNIVKTQKAILPHLTLGKQQLANVPVGFFEGAIGRQKMSIMGSDVLKRFNLIIDAQRQYVYLKPNKQHRVPYSNS